MSDSSEDTPKPGDSDGAGQGQSPRNLFGHKSGAKPWGAAPPEKLPDPVPAGKAVEAGPASAHPDASAPQTSSAPYPRDASYTPRPEVSDAASIFSELDDEGELTLLHPNYKLLMRFAALFISAVILFVSLAVDAALSENTVVPFGVVTAPGVLLAIFVALRVPLARYNAKGYQISRDRLRVVRGIMFRSDTVVPFGRVQHIDVDQGPIERALGIATLTLHTAGSHNASVHLPGLGHDLAVEMREAIRAHIKRETL